jgi:threonine dehydrogenase-like Zn-dependent dehydrogenase
MADIDLHICRNKETLDIMKALIYNGPGKLLWEDRPIPKPKTGEVLIKVRAVSICGSDLGAYRLHEVSDRWAPPIVLGHEFSGEVAGLSEGVQNLSIGQAVTVNPILFCGECYYCKHGHINLCPNRFSLGTSIGGITHDGALQEYLTVRASAVFPLPASVNFLQGALTEPLSVSLCAARMGDYGEGERVAIIGAGPIGLMVLKFLKSEKSKKIFVSDILQSRLDLAKELGADEVINGQSDVVAVIKDLTDSVGVDRVVIAAGAQSVLESSFKMLRNGGSTVLVALMHQKVELDPFPIVARQLALLGSYMFTDEFSDVIQSLAEKKIDVDNLITSVRPLSEGIEVFNDLCRPDCKDVKVILTNN